MQLNKWLGADKPKKDDFNNDNQKIDEACRLLSQSVEQLDYAQKNNSYATAQSLSAHTGNSSIHVSESALSSHTDNSGIHVTAAEKSLWSGGAGLSIGYYTGDGGVSQSISLGFQPKFGLIFEVNEGIARITWSNDMLQTHFGCMSQLGCSLGISLNPTGFTVTHSAMGTVDGFALKFNVTGARYVYFIWR